MSDTEVLAKLNAMQANPPKAEDHPYLSKLVDAVLEKKEVISDDKLFELSSLMSINLSFGPNATWRP